MRAVQHQSGIYRLTIGDSYYIGSAKYLRKREREHLKALENGSHANDRLQKCWNKYGSHRWDILELCDELILLEREQHFLDFFISDERCVNVLPTAGSCLGRKHSEETKRKIAEANQGQKRTPEQIERIRQAQLLVNQSPEVLARKADAQRGKKMSPETRRKISASLQGREFTDDHRQRLSEAGKTRTVTPETRQKLSQANMGRKNPAEAVEKTRQANLGSKRSEATRQKMREAWEHRRQASSGKNGTQAEGTNAPSPISLI